jgi:hypothetical protein
MSALLPQLKKSRRKDLVKASERLLEQGIQPTPVAEGTAERPLKRQEVRRLQRAMGYRGSKAKRHNVKRNMARMQQVLLVEEALDAAQDRKDHPIRSRLKGY